MGLQKHKLLVDTNVVLDVLLARKPFDEWAVNIFKLAALVEVELFISINSFTDIIYFVSKEYDSDTVRKQMAGLLDFCRIIEAGHRDALQSLKLTDFEDIEDAFQSYCAEKEIIDYIITRDLKGFKSSKIPALTPQEYLLKSTSHSL